MPKVLFTASTFSHIRNFHLPYLAQFKRLGWQVHVACGGAVADIPGADEVFALPLEKKMLAAGNFQAASLLGKKMAAEQYALVSVHTSLAAFFTRLAAARLGSQRPNVLNMVHGYLFDGQTPAAKKAILLAAEKLTAGCTDLLLTMNKWDEAAACQHHLGRQFGFIPGVGVDFVSFAARQNPEASLALRQSLGLGPEDKLLIYAAEFSGRKSQPVLLRAMARLRELMAAGNLELPGRVVLLLAGQGAEFAACQSLAGQLGLLAESGGPVQAVFPGQLSDMPLWYGAADIAVSASRSEGLPFNIMEAMYAGLPVVASAVKGHTDLLQPEQSGLLYPYGDPEACAGLLLRLLREPDLAARLGAEARRQVQQYGLAQVFPQVWAQYERLIGQIK